MQIENKRFYYLLIGLQFYLFVLILAAAGSTFFLHTAMAAQLVICLLQSDVDEPVHAVMHMNCSTN